MCLWAEIGKLSFDGMFAGRFSDPADPLQYAAGLLNGNATAGEAGRLSAPNPFHLNNNSSDRRKNDRRIFSRYFKKDCIMPKGGV
ncbi:MAG: hypothetical protein ACI3XG_04850 [Faecousia sp.]